MSAAERKTNRKPVNKTEVLANHLSCIACNLITIRALVFNIALGDGVKTVAALQALIEKTGYLADQSLETLGEPAMCGDFEAWRTTGGA